MIDGYITDFHKCFIYVNINTIIINIRFDILFRFYIFTCIFKRVVDS